MKLIRSGREAQTSAVAPEAVDWAVVSGLQVWAMENTPPRHDTPGGLDIAWIKAAGVRYAVTIIFEDDTWVWTDLTVDPEAALATVHRLSAEHDKPVQRSGRAADELLRARGY